MEDALLRQLFLQRLPKDVPVVLAAAGNVSLADLVPLANSVMEIIASPVSAFESIQEPIPVSSQS